MTTEMKKKTLFLLSMVISIISHAQVSNELQAYFDPQTKVVNCDKRFPKVNIGWSYIEQNEIPLPSIGGCPFKSCTPVTYTPTGSNIVSNSILVETDYDYCQAKNINIAAAASYAFVKASGSYGKKYEYSKNSKTIYWMIEYQKISRVEYLDNYDYNNKADSILKVSETDFYKKYGKYYVATIGYGQRVRLVFKYEATSESEASNVRLQAQAYVNYVKGGASLSVQTSEAIKSTLSSSKIQIEIDAVGVDDSSAIINLVTSDPANINQNFKTFLTNSISNQAPVVLGVRSHEKNPFVSDYSDLLLSKALYVKYKLEGENNLLTMINNSSRFTQATKDSFNLIGQKQKREQYLIDLKKTAKKYMLQPNDSTEKILFAFLNKSEDKSFILNIPEWYILHDTKSDCIGNESSLIITLVVKPNTNYTIAYNVRVSPHDTHGDNGYFRAETDFVIPETGTNINLGDNFTRNNESFNHPGNLTINSGDHSTLNCQIKVFGVEWAKDNQVRKNTTCAKLDGFTVTATEQ